MFCPRPEKCVGQTCACLPRLCCVRSCVRPCCLLEGVRGWAGRVWAGRMGWAWPRARWSGSGSPPQPPNHRTVPLYRRAQKADIFIIINATCTDLVMVRSYVEEVAKGEQ